MVSWSMRRRPRTRSCCGHSAAAAATSASSPRSSSRSTRSAPRSRAERSSSPPKNEIHVHDLRGAVAKQPAGGSAFPHREAPYVLNVIGKWPGGGPGPEHVTWARDVVSSMEEFGTGAAYVNFLGDDESADRLRAAYGEDTYEGLVEAKN